jgi:hypothetical protein
MGYRDEIYNPTRAKIEDDARARYSASMEIAPEIPASSLSLSDLIEMVDIWSRDQSRVHIDLASQQVSKAEFIEKMKAKMLT